MLGSNPAWALKQQQEKRKPDFPFLQLWKGYWINSLDSWKNNSWIIPGITSRGNVTANGPAFQQGAEEQAEMNPLVSDLLSLQFPLFY